jgi:hypothetical protein
MRKVRQLKVNRKAKDFISDDDFKKLIAQLDKMLFPTFQPSYHHGTFAILADFLPHLVLGSTEDAGVLGELLGDLDVLLIDELGGRLLHSGVDLLHNNSPFSLLVATLISVSLFGEVFPCFLT